MASQSRVWLCVGDVAGKPDGLYDLSFMGSFCYFSLVCAIECADAYGGYAARVDDEVEGKSDRAAFEFYVLVGSGVVCRLCIGGAGEVASSDAER